MLPIVAVFACLAVASSAETKTGISPAKTDRHGIRIHTVTSPFQSGRTKIRVLLPDKLDSSKRSPVLYVLPVEARDESRYGDGLLEAKKRNLHNRHGLICVAPTFSHLPWYADHPTDKTIRQESYMLKVVLPFMEKTYPAIAKPNGRLLVGFSKSGWGACSMLLRHPDTFHKAAAWDAPLLKAKPNQFGMGAIFGTQENFERYRITSLLRKRAKQFGKQRRLILTSYDNFRSHHVGAHKLLKELKIPHAYCDGPQRKHHWHSGWLEEAVRFLMQQSVGIDALNPRCLGVFARD